MSLGPRSLFRTPAFISLALSAVGAVVLYVGRERFYGSDWFPLAIGLTAAAAIIPLLEWVRVFFDSKRTGNWHHILLFGFSSIWMGAGAVFLIFFANEVLWGFVLAAACGICFYAALGTRYCWPGFREDCPDEDCPFCLGDGIDADGGPCIGCEFDED